MNFWLLQKAKADWASTKMKPTKTTNTRCSFPFYPFNDVKCQNTNHFMMHQEIIDPGSNIFPPQVFWNFELIKTTWNDEKKNIIDLFWFESNLQRNRFIELSSELDAPILDRGQKIFGLWDDSILGLSNFGWGAW